MPQEETGTTTERVEDTKAEETEAISPTRADVVCLKAAREYVRTWARSGPLKIDPLTKAMRPTTPHRGIFNIPAGQVVVRKVPSIPHVQDSYWILENYDKNGALIGATEIPAKVALLETLAVELAVDCCSDMQKEVSAAAKMSKLIDRYGMDGVMQSLLLTEDDLEKETEEVAM